MNTSELHVVLGASGGFGSAVVRELVARGKRVRAVSRKRSSDLPTHAEFMNADVSTLDGARAACKDATVVYFCSQPAYDKWSQEFPNMLTQVITGASEAGAKLIFADNLYVYAPTAQPLTETLPHAPVTRKGKVRKQMDETLLAAHKNGIVRVSIARASNYYGPNGRNTILGDRFFEQLLGGKKVQWLGKLDLPHSLSYTEDVARGLILLGEHDIALGQDWHIPAAEPLTGRQYIEMAGQIAGIPGRAAEVTPLMLRMAGLFNAVIREQIEMQYEFLEPYILDGSKFARAFDFQPTDHQQAFQTTIAWFRDNLQVKRVAA